MIFDRFKTLDILLICCFFIFVIQSCSSTPPIKQTPQFQSSHICLSADGYGDTRHTAQLNAREEMSKLIIVEIESLLIDRLGSKNNEIFREVIKRSRERSKMLFKGIICTPPDRIDLEFHCRAILTQKAYIDTIIFLKGKTFVNLDYCSKEDYYKILVYVSHLEALLTTPTQCRTSSSDLLKKIRQQFEKIKKRLSCCLITFKTKPKDAVLTIDKKKYKPYSRIFLLPGIYKIDISKQGYQTKKRDFFIDNSNKGLRKDLIVSLVPSGITVYVDLLKQNRHLKRNIENLLVDNGLTLSRSPSTDRVLKVNYTHLKNKIQNFDQHVLEISIAAVKRHKKVYVHSEKLSYFDNLNSKRLLHKNQNALLKTAIDKLLTKIDWNHF